MLRKPLFVLALALQAATAQSRIPVVLSTDVGNEVDDQWAIVYLLLHPTFDVRGILSAHAPSISPPAGKVSLEILRSVVEQRLGMATHPPLFEGASLPLASRTQPRPSPAVDFLIQASQGYTETNRLQVLNIGAITDVASAILKDPSITRRIRVLNMGFNSAAQGGNEFNIANDPLAMQVVLDSDVPLVTGPGDVCRRDLALTLDQARAMVAGRGPVGQWLWTEFLAWYYRHVKPLRKDDFSKPWMIWDNIVLAHLLGMTESREADRPAMTEAMSFTPSTVPGRKMTWITRVDSARMWADFVERLDLYQSTHAVPGR
ncbi:MAG: nucleoside hydrolase [Bryobacteraceae bacterium]|nr:nucleoside hydrolase [Bryobacteraceae bacterium]